MENFFKKCKKIVALSAVVALVLLQNSGMIVSLGFFNNNNKIGNVYANYSSTEISVANSEFESPISSNYPISPSNFTMLDQDERVTSGLISVDQTTFEQKSDDYNIAFNPGKHVSVEASEDKVLMINSESVSTSMGYQSSSFVLEKNGYYTVEFLVYTQNANQINAGASVYLTGDENVEQNANSTLSPINTLGTWQSYKFFVETDTIEDKTLNLEMYLGSKNDFTSQGAVFFDNIKVMAHSNERYYSEINNLSYLQENYSILNLKQEKVQNAVVNPSFEETINDPATNDTGWETLTANNSVADSEYAINGVYNVDQNFSSTQTGVDTAPNNANIYNNTKALLINNLSPASIGFRSSDILIEQHKLYKLSMLVKTGNLTEGATIKLNQQNPYGEDNETYQPVESSIAQVNTDNKTNEKYANWIEYSFTIKGSVFFDSYANLELWLGSEEQSQAGYVFFDNVELYELTTDEFNSISTEETVEQVDFSNLSSSPSISNAYFNDVTVENIDETYPHDPQNWQVSSDSDNYNFALIQNGVVNTNTDHFNNNSNTYNFSNPGNLNNQINGDVSNNVLVMGNRSSTSQTYSSSATTLDASEYYLFSFYVQTQGVSSNNVSTRILNGSTPIFTLNNLQSELTWTKHSVYIKTGLNEVNASINLLLGTKQLQVSGFAFFDNVNISKIEADSYDNALTDNLNTIDLNNENFNSISATPTNGLYTPLNYSGQKVSADVNDEFINAGVLNTADFSDYQNFHPGLVNPNSASENSSNVLTISATEDAHYTYTSSKEYSINANTYYKFTTYVKTFGLSQRQENIELDENDNPILYGASVGLTNFNDNFTAINTQLNETTNEYKEYSFYISSDSNKTFNATLSLGSENALTRGYAFFSNLSLSEISEDEYTSTLDLLNSPNPPNNVINLLNTGTEDQTEDDTEQTPQAGVDFDFLLLPTLILSAALIFAVIAYSLRQIKFNKLIRKRIKSEIYDRNRTLAVDHERREVVKERQARLEKLKEQLEQLKTELEQNEKDYKVDKQDYKELEKEAEQKQAKEKLTDKQAKSYKEKRKQELKKQKEQKYREKRERLQREFNKVEKEIEKLEREERIMFEKYRNYRAQVKAIKQEIKQKQKQQRIKRKQKRAKEKQKKRESKTENKNK
jgi:hypothetical protein